MPIRLARALAVLVALALLAASVLKVVSPYEATAALRWTGLPYALRMALVHVGCWVEAALALWVLLSWKQRLPHLALSGLCLALLLLHIVQRASGACGCFGSLTVPEPVTIGLLVVGVLAGVSASRLLPRSGDLPIVRIALSAVLGLAVFLPLLWKRGNAASPEHALVARDDAARDDVLYVIGSQSCQHCAEVMDELRKRRADGKLAWQVVFVEREGDTAAGAMVNLEGMDRLSVPDELWWNLITDAPPAFVMQQKGEKPERVATVPGESNQNVMRK